MSSAAVPGLNRTFALDPSILGPKSSASLQLSGATDGDVLLAVADNRPFPSRPEGVIDLARIGLSASGGDPVAFKSGQTTVGFSFSAGVTAGVGIFDDPAKAIAALGLDKTPGLTLTPGPSADGSRFALMRAGYQAKGSVSGSHPIGALGSVTFGVSATASGMSAVIRRFPAQTGARDVLEQTVKSWKLPRHVTTADALSPATWVVAEANGSLALKLAAKLGYNFNFVRQAKLAGLSGDVGLKIDAAATASFGFEVSGRYLVAVGRESDSEADRKVRLRLFKLSTQGMNFGLNLKVGVSGVAGILPNKVDDFTRAVFGVHGAQAVKTLKLIQQWTDPKKSVGELVAGLANEKALELLKDVTGVDPVAAFQEARGKLLDAVGMFETLPPQVSSELWGILSGLNGSATAAFRSSLILLASSNEQTQKAELLKILNTNGFASTPAGRLLSALADRGLLNLLDRLPDVRKTASTVHAILEGGTLTKLQTWLSDRLDLDKVLNAVSQADFNKLDSFLVGRLATFFDKTLGFADLKEVKDTINLVVSKRQEIYAKAKKALTSRYGFDLAATWSKTSSSTAVLDVVFDTSQQAGIDLLAAVLQDSKIDELLITPSPAVHLNSAVLSHEVTRKTTLDLSLPHFSFQSVSINRGLASVHAEEDGGRILLYDATGSDTVQVTNKYKSSLTVTFAAAVSPAGAATFPNLRIHSADAATWSYQLLQAKESMRREELEAFTRPFINQYMASQFTGGTSLSSWYTQFDRTVENVLNNGVENFGDVCAAYAVTIPGNALSAWAMPIDDVTAAVKSMSKDIQKSLKLVIPFYYLQSVDKLKDLASSAPLLAWASIRASNDVKVNGNTLTFDVGKNVFWNHPDPAIRRLMVDNQITSQNLVAMLPSLRLRLQEAGLDGSVQFYEDNQAPAILRAAMEGSGRILLESLLRFEAQIVEKAAKALKDVQEFRKVSATAPSKAVERLAEFAADITNAFHKLAGQTVFGGETLRSVSQAVFADASRSLDGTLNIPPRAMLTILVLKPQAEREFELSTFLTGSIPEEKDVAVAQHLVNA